MNKGKLKSIIVIVLLVAIFATTSSLAATVQKNIKVIYSDIKVMVNGVKITPKDATGKVVEPFIFEGTTYLPVRAISEALGEQVGWDHQTQTVYIGERPTVTYSSCGPEEFLKRHEPYKGRNFIVKGPGTLKIRQKDFNYFNSITSDGGPYLIDGQYTKIKGLFILGDDNSGGTSRFFQVHGDGVKLFDGMDYLVSLGYEGGMMKQSDQPVPFEVNITGVKELNIRFPNGNSYATIFNVEFIGFDN